MLTVHLCKQFICSSTLCQMLRCAKCSSVPILWCTKCLNVSNIPVYQNLQLCQIFWCAKCSTAPNVRVCQIFLCVKYSSVPNFCVCQIFKCAKFSCVPNVQVCQQEQQLHKRRRSIKSPFTCFACLALPGPGQTVLIEWSFEKSSSSERKWNFSEEEKGKSNGVKSLKNWGNLFLKLEMRILLSEKPRYWSLK